MKVTETDGGVTFSWRKFHWSRRAWGLALFALYLLLFPLRHFIPFEGFFIIPIAVLCLPVLIATFGLLFPRRLTVGPGRVTSHPGPIRFWKKSNTIEARRIESCHYLQVTDTRWKLLATRKVDAPDDAAHDQKEVVLADELSTVGQAAYLKHQLSTRLELRQPDAGEEGLRMAIRMQDSRDGAVIEPPAQGLPIIPES